jgi:hypothetical protein
MAFGLATLGAFAGEKQEKMREMLGKVREKIEREANRKETPSI